MATRGCPEREEAGRVGGPARAGEGRGPRSIEVRLPQVDLSGPAGRIEALLDEVPGASFAALVCHPHPRYGGTMHNHATYRLARALRGAGGTTLRFNYRGVGRSAGTYAG